MTPHRTNRRAFTLLELVVVLAVLLLLAVALLPSLTAFRGDSRPRAAADVVRGELAHARARAMEDGVPYRVAISSDKKRIRRGPADDTFATATAAGQPGAQTRVVDYAFDDATAEVLGGAAAENGYVTIATVKPDGSCVEELVFVELTDKDKQTMYIQVRGLTGSSRVVPKPNLDTNTNRTGGKP